MFYTSGLFKLFLDMRGKILRVLEGRVFKSGSLAVNKFGTVLFDGADTFQQEQDLIQNNADSLKKFLVENGVKTRRALICLGREGIIARTIKVPRMSLSDLKTHMQLEMNDYVPVNSEEYSFDYKIINTFSEDDREFFSVMVAAALKKHIDECVSIVEMAGLKPLAVDIFPNVMWRLIADKFNDIAVVDAGRDGTRLMLCQGENLVLYTDIPYQFENHGEDDFSQLTREIGGYLDFFASRHFGKTVDRIYITGELAAHSNAPEILNGMLNIPVSLGMQKEGIPDIKGSAGDFKRIASVYAGNVGLMLREV